MSTATTARKVTTDTRTDEEKKADRSAAAKKAAATRAAKKAALAATTEAPATEAPAELEATEAPATEAPKDITHAGLRLVEDRPGIWIALKGGTAHRPFAAKRVGTVLRLNDGKLCAIGEGTKSEYVDTPELGLKFIASTITVKAPKRSVQAALKDEIRDATRAHNTANAHKNGYNKAAYKILPAQIDRLTERVADAQAKYAETGLRAHRMTADSLARKLAEKESRRDWAIGEIAWANTRIREEVDHLRVLRDKALGMGMKQADVDNVVRGVRKSSDPEAEARRIHAMFADATLDD